MPNPSRPPPIFLESERWGEFVEAYAHDDPDNAHDDLFTLPDGSHITLDEWKEMTMKKPDKFPPYHKPTDDEIIDACRALEVKVQFVWAPTHPTLSFTYCNPHQPGGWYAWDDVGDLVRDIQTTIGKRICAFMFEVQWRNILSRYGSEEILL